MEQQKVSTRLFLLLEALLPLLTAEQMIELARRALHELSEPDRIELLAELGEE